ncbi:MAG: hypothetical protein KDK39_17325 [Leptospiraceae bacterium]|nr:hypothetical protein [Leptospiraceae bacterium]
MRFAFLPLRPVLFAPSISGRSAAGRCFICRRAALFLLILFIQACGGATPHNDDLRRVKADYLDMRSRAPFHKMLQSKTDAEIMQMACLKNKVNCQEVLKLFETEDKVFYEAYQKLTEVRK